MLLTLSCLLAPALFALARQRAEIIRLRVERRLSHVPHGSWAAFRDPPPPDTTRAGARHRRA